jgi:hypothetical protein
MRPLTRLRLVLPGSKGPDLRVPPTVEALAARVADALAVVGVQVRQQVAGAPSDGAPRADVALWLPDVDGANPGPDPRTAPARVQAAFVVEPSPSNGLGNAASAKALSRFDALVVPHESLREPLRAALRRATSRKVPVVVVRLPGEPLMAREAEKALRGVAGRRVVLLDVREGFDGDIERVIVQLGLKSQEGAVVLLAPHDERARNRIRSLCERHAVDAFLASGADGFALSIVAADLFLGRPSWDELMLAALHRTSVASLPMTQARALLEQMSKLRLVDEVVGTLQLAAALDRKLADPGSIDARGLALREALCGPERELVEALSSLEPTPQGHGASSWEAVGPQAARQNLAGGPGNVVVEARDANVPPEPSRAQRIEDALEALKQKIATGG